MIYISYYIDDPHKLNVTPTRPLSQYENRIFKQINIMKKLNYFVMAMIVVFAMSCKNDT